MMLRLFLSLLTSSAAFGLIACGDSGGYPADTSTAKPPRSGAVTSALASASSSGPIGIAECDDYVERMRACIEKAPAEERAKRKEAIDAVESAWTTQAKSATDKSLVQSACRQSLSAVQAAGCN